MSVQQPSGIVNVQEVQPVDFLDGMEKSGCFPELAKALRASSEAGAAADQTPPTSTDDVEESSDALDWLQGNAGFCGCGDPLSAMQFLYKVLKLAPFHQDWKLVRDLFPNDGMYHFVLYQLNHLGLMEHGGSVGGGWLTERGELALKLLQADPDVVAD